ncbi:hypothetical protein [Agrobacterium tumefaciens]|nr:hypothetical protein [Agrobacterium tumefaciens]MDS7594063.1 hypothetical protein [Agrobacterium tumefaciens]
MPKTADPDALATFVLIIAHGIAVQAKAGADPELLRTVVQQALAGWPR